MIFLTLLDIFLLAIVVLWSGDELRQLRAVASPLRSAVFYLLAIICFGWIAHNLQGHAVHWWALALHALLAAIAMIAFGTHHPHGQDKHELDRQSPRRPA